jgi:Outer membrane protein beta-barrel domain
LKTIKSNVNISGLGKCNVDVVDELNTNISGAGTVTYKSTPKKLNENVSGVGKIKNMEESDSYINTFPDTTKLDFGKKKLWIIGKKDSTRSDKHKVKPMWAGFEMGVNSYMDNGGTFTLSPGKKNFELRAEKSVSVGLNILQSSVELGKSNVWLFTGLGITWNNYRFENNLVLDNGSYTTAHLDSTPGVRHIKSKLVASYLTAPVMIEFFTSRNEKKAFHLGAGAMLGLRIGSHTKRKIEIDGDASKIKDFDDYNLNPFRYGFRVAIGYGSFNIFADYYASTLFRDNKGPVLYPVNVGITLVDF